MSNPPKALIIGRPVKHARSPLIHAYWLEKLGIAGAYDRQDVMPGAVSAVLRELPSRGYVGGNVTVPHKEEAFLACDRLSEVARAVKAVNTLWFEDGKLCGDNTDGSGFVAHLDQTHPAWDHDHPRILLLGSGGAARGLMVPLLERAPKAITVTNRSEERAQKLAEDVRLARPEADIRVIPWDERESALSMNGQPTLELDLSNLPAAAIIADIVYIPLETPLLAAARKRGLRILDGLGMLLHQAVPGFERWFGVKPAVTDELRAHILADLLPKTA